MIEYQEKKKSRLYKLTMIMMKVAKKQGSEPHEHYARYYPRHA